MIDTKIYVECLATRNMGCEHGAWLNCENQDSESLMTEIQELLDSSPVDGAEEWVITAYDFPAELTMGENPDLEELTELADLTQKHGVAYALYADNVGLSCANKDGFQDSYQGYYESEEAFAEEISEGLGDIPSHLQPYISWERYASDLFCGDYYSLQDQGITYVFRS
jgi:antirestriction protein